MQEITLNIFFYIFFIFYFIFFIFFYIFYFFTYPIPVNQVVGCNFSIYDSKIAQNMSGFFTFQARHKMIKMKLLFFIFFLFLLLYRIDHGRYTGVISIFMYYFININLSTFMQEITFYIFFYIFYIFLCFFIFIFYFFYFFLIYFLQFLFFYIPYSCQSGSRM